jgi:DNA-binding NarL/FixJ family response regulator
MSLLRVLLVEDHPLIQVAIRDFLSQYCTVVATLDSAGEIENTIRDLLPDVVVLDVSLPDRSGMQVLPELRSKFPHLVIVMATNHTEPIYRAEALKRGADAFVGKDRLQEDLWASIRAAHSAPRHLVVNLSTR